MRAGRFAGPVDIELLTPTGAIVATATLTTPNAYATKSFALRPKVSTVIYNSRGMPIGHPAAEESFWHSVLAPWRELKVFVPEIRAKAVPCCVRRSSRARVPLRRPECGSSAEPLCLSRRPHGNVIYPLELYLHGRRDLPRTDHCRSSGRNLWLASDSDWQSGPNDHAATAISKLWGRTIVFRMPQELAALFGGLDAAWRSIIRQPAGLGATGRV